MPPGQQAGSPQACPESICILGCDIVRVPLDASSAVHSRSPSRLAPDALLERLFRNVHHPGHGAGAACGSLEPPPARRFRGAYPHRQRSIASGCLIYIGLPSTFVAQRISGTPREVARHYRTLAAAGVAYFIATVREDDSE